MSVPANRDDDSLSHRVAHEWFQPDLSAPSDLTTEPAWLRGSDSTELPSAPDWFQPELSVPSDLTAEPAWLGVSDSTELPSSPEWFQPELRVPSDLSAEPVWLEASDSNELTPAEIWSPDYEEDITLQSKRAEKAVEDVTEDGFDDWNAIRASSQIHVFDELPFLRSEESFATLPINEKIQPPPAKPQEPATIDDSITMDRSRVRLLDEAEVLQGEQSFATVLTDQPRRARTYSPQREFLLKTGFSPTQLVLAKLLVVSVIFVTGLLSLIIARGVFNSPPTMSSAPRSTVTALPGNTEPKVVIPSRSPAPAPVSETAAHRRADSLLPGKEDTKLNLNSEPRRKTSRETVTSNIPAAHSKQKEPEPSVKTSPKEARSSPQQKLNSTNTSKKTHANEKANASVRRSASTQTSHKGTAGSRVERKPAAPSPKAIVEIAKDKPTASVVSGGGQRPRRVTP